MTTEHIEILKKRALIYRAIRKFFDDLGFIEVTTPTALSEAAPEEFIESVSSESNSEEDSSSSELFSEEGDSSSEISSEESSDEITSEDEMSSEELTSVHDELSSESITEIVYQSEYTSQDLLPIQSSLQVIACLLCVVVIYIVLRICKFIVNIFF